MRAITQFVGDRELALAPDEAALLAKYRAADTAGKRSLQAVSDALAVYGDQQKVS